MQKTNSLLFLIKYYLSLLIVLLAGAVIFYFACVLLRIMVTESREVIQWRALEWMALIGVSFPVFLIGLYFMKLNKSLLSSPKPGVSHKIYKWLVIALGVLVGTALALSYVISSVRL